MGCYGITSMTCVLHGKPLLHPLPPFSKGGCGVKQWFVTHSGGKSEGAEQAEVGIG